MQTYLNWAYRLGCANCALAVIIGAAGGHKPWPQEQKDIFSKGVLYHFMNSVGMIISALAPQSYLATSCFAAGVVLFCLPLYHRAFTGSKQLSSVTPPFGGMAMIAGWALLAFKK